MSLRCGEWKPSSPNQSQHSFLPPGPPAPSFTLKLLPVQRNERRKFSVMTVNSTKPRAVGK